MHDPSASQSLPRLGCLWGTFSPSRCQIRSTRLSLIIQPAWRRSSATFDNIGCETLLVVTTARDLALRRAMLPERRTGATLGNMQLRSDLRQIGNRLAQPAVLELKVLQALHLLGLQPTKLLAPPIIRHLAHADLADCVHHILALRDQDIHLPQLRDDLFRLVSLPCHYSPP